MKQVTKLLCICKLWTPDRVSFVSHFPPTIEKGINNPQKRLSKLVKIKQILIYPMYSSKLIYFDIIMDNKWWIILGCLDRKLMIDLIGQFNLFPVEYQKRS